MNDLTISIVGLGLIGGSIALKLKEEGFTNIYAIDRKPEFLKEISEQGIVKIGTEESLKKSDLVIVCLYPKATIEYVEANIQNFKKNVVITDVSGVKSVMSERIGKVLEKDMLFIPAHPMAGREKGGFDNATKDLFLDANYLLMNKSDDKRFKMIENVVKALGAKSVYIEEEVHDKMIALTSHVPHVLASIVTRINKFDDTKKFVGNSFDDVTRISLINEKLWSELFVENKAPLVEFLSEITKELNQFIEYVENDDVESVKGLLLETRKMREDYLKS